MDQNQAALILIETKKILDNLGIHFWLTDGTLLGFYRENNFIKHDSDIDLAVFIKDHSDRLIPEFVKQEFSLLNIFGTIQAGLEYSFSKNGINLDVFFMYEESDYWWYNIWFTPSSFKTQQLIKLSYPKSKFKQIIFCEHEFNIPENTLEYLYYPYGYFWQIPDTNWHWMFSPKSIIDAPFLQLPERELKRNYHLITQLYTQIISSLITEYQQNHTNKSVLLALQKTRKEQADFWLLQSDDTVNNTYSGLMGIAYELLLNSGIKTEQTPEKEQQIINQIQNNSKQSLLAKSLYSQGEQTSINTENTASNWVEDYQKIENLKLFQELNTLINEDKFGQFSCYLLKLWFWQLLEKLILIGRQILPVSIRHKLWILLIEKLYIKLYNNLKFK